MKSNWVLVASCLLFFSALTSGCISSLNEGEHTPPDPHEINTSNVTNLNSNSIELEVHQLVNEHRNEIGLQPLEFNTALQYSARVNSRKLADVGNLVHTFTQGQSYFDKLRRFGYVCESGHENIAYIDFLSIGDRNESEIATEIAMVWFNSKPHREAIEDREMSYHGIGIHFEGSQVYATEHLCKRDGDYEEEPK